MESLEGKSLVIEISSLKLLGSQQHHQIEGVLGEGVIVVLLLYYFVPVP